MKFHIIIDHPWKESFNFAILNSIINVLETHGQEYDLLDLNREDFNPVMSEKELAVYAEGKIFDPIVKEYQQRLMAADYLIVIFPVWWNVMPAKLKGWMDKVLTPGFAFTTGQIPDPLLKHIKGALVLTTTGSPDDLHRESYNNTIKWVLCEGTLKFCGIDNYNWLNFGDTGFVSREKHAEWIRIIEKEINNIITKSPIHNIP